MTIEARSRNARDQHSGTLGGDSTPFQAASPLDGAANPSRDSARHMTSKSVGEPHEPGIGRRRSPLAVAAQKQPGLGQCQTEIRDIPELAELTKFENVKASLRPVGARLHQPYNPDHPQAPNRPRPGRSYCSRTHLPHIPDSPITDRLSAQIPSRKQPEQARSADLIAAVLEVDPGLPWRRRELEDFVIAQRLRLSQRLGDRGKSGDR